MRAKKNPVDPARAQIARVELKYLYARRAAIDSLIRSLVSYDRTRVKALENGKQRSA